MRKTLKQLALGLMVAGLLLASASMVMAASITINNIDGDWANATGGANVIISNDQSPNGRTATVSWGETSSIFNWWNPKRSSYEFLSAFTPITATTEGTTKFSLGIFTHNNFAIPSGTAISGVDLILNLGIANLEPLTATFDFNHNETPNTGGSASNDIITLTNPILNKESASSG